MERGENPKELLKNLIELDFKEDWDFLKKIKYEIEIVYHIAACMSYSLLKLSKVLDVNQKQSVDFYQKINDYFPTAKSFVYSTAFTVGTKPEKIIKEELHPKPFIVNSYQMSKWATEMSLSFLSEELNVPLVIMRPSIIVGERGSGRYSGKDYGLYMFARYFLMAKVMGLKKIRLDISSKNTLNLISINSITELLLKISKLKLKKKYTIIHGTSSHGTKVSDIALSLKRVWGIELLFEKPKTLIDRIVSKMTSLNQEFAENREWNFESEFNHKLLQSEKLEVRPNDLNTLFEYYAKEHHQHLKSEIFHLIKHEVMCRSCDLI